MSSVFATGISYFVGDPVQCLLVAARALLFLGVLQPEQRGEHLCLTIIAKIQNLTERGN